MPITGRPASCIEIDLAPFRRRAIRGSLAPAMTPPAGFDWPDLLAPLLYLTLWAGYAFVADDPRRGRSTLMNRMHQYRLVWLRRTLERDNRILDAQIANLLSQNISFFGSTAILIVGGLVAVLGAGEQVRGVLADLPLVAAASARLWEFKVFLLIVTFVYAFFKFTWALRQFNYVAIMIGAAPLAGQGEPEEIERFAERAARVASLAADHSNKALRAYYFGLAGLSWFINAWLFMALTVWVVLVLYRREFRSVTLAMLGAPDQPIEGAGPVASPRR
jgi:uncharacterized membrane protein